MVIYAEIVFITKFLHNSDISCRCDFIVILHIFRPSLNFNSIKKDAFVTVRQAKYKLDCLSGKSLLATKDIFFEDNFDLIAS
jgi:hypothetical protein